MKEIGAYEAKTHMAELLDEVSAGNSVTITRHGTPVAIVMPVSSGRKAPVPETIAKLRRLRIRNKLGELSLKELIEEGRK